MSQRRREEKRELVYERDEESDDEIDLSFLEFEAEKFKPATTLCDDPFLNMICEENMLKNTYFDGDEGDGGDEAEGGREEEHEHLEDENEEGIGVEFRVHDPSVKWNKMKPVVGEVYESPAQLKFALINYAVSNGYQLWFMKSDKTRLIVKCGKPTDKKQCPFRIYASWKYNERSFQIKSMIETHLCARNFKFGALVSCNWLAKHYLKDIIRKPKMTLAEMKEDVLRKFSVEVSKSQCHRARVRAREMIEGKLDEHYGRVWDYTHEIIRSNPGSTCKVGVTVNPDGTTYFQRFYVCFKSFRDGWNAGYRRVIGLDGCFLKGQIKGELLTAIGRDANNHVYPIAWAVVNVENKDNWTWFLEFLSDDLGLDGGRGLVVISDQHKGLLQAVKDILPNVEHRQCARHICANFNKSLSGLEMKNMFWAAATCTVEADFISKMEEIRKVTQKGYDWLMARNPASWCRAFFSQDFACESVENGFSECFNAMIVVIRKKPLLTMLEEIRIYMMDRFYFMAEEASKWTEQICPVIIKRMEVFGKEMRLWKVIPSGGNVLETRYAFTSYKVDLDSHICTCRLWELSGIPCVHAQAAINYTHDDPKHFISQWFGRDKFLSAYRNNIQPVNGSNMWAHTEYNKPLPPLTRRLPGRPKTKRRKYPSEATNAKYPTAKAKVNRTVRCSKCLQLGHNIKSCTNAEVAREAPSPKKTGRPRRTGSAAVKPNPKPPASGEGTSTGGVRRGNMEVSRGGSSRRYRGKRVQLPTQESQIHSRGQETHQEDEMGQESQQESQLMDETGRDEVVYDEGTEDNAVPEQVYVDKEVVRDMEEAGYLSHEIEHALAGVLVRPKIVPGVEMEVEERVGDEEETDSEAEQEAESVPKLPKLPVKRKVSERILKNKLKKAVYDKDGGGSSLKKPISLE